MQQLDNSAKFDIKDSEHPPLGHKALPRTCSTARVANPLLTSGLYWIDPDGPAFGEEPIRVYCNMNTGQIKFLNKDSPGLFLH